MSNPLDELDGLGLAALVKSGEVTAHELLTLTLKRVEERNPAINAVVQSFEEKARAQIDAGLSAGPFKGVPFLLKDMSVGYQGTKTTGGSRFFADYVAQRNATLVDRYLDAGLVIFGKTNAPEMGLCLATEPDLYGPCRNPWNPDRVPGGSSGGASAAVAARMLPMAHATDGGGSIRVPASTCGLFGMKPTRGRVPAGPEVGEGWNGLSHGHAVTLSVRDSAALLDATLGPAPGDPYGLALPARPFVEEVSSPIEILRIGVSAHSHQGAIPSDEVRAALIHTAQLCAELGHLVEWEDPTYDHDAFQAARLKIIPANIRAVLNRRAKALGREVTEADVEPVTWAMAEIGRAMPASDYLDAVLAMHKLGREFAAYHQRYDVLLTPTNATEPVPVGWLDTRLKDLSVFRDRMNAFGGYTAIFNMTGQPAMSVPLAWSKAGLPLGMQFIAEFGREDVLFRLAGQLEKAQPWFNKRPSLWG